MELAGWGKGGRRKEAVGAREGGGIRALPPPRAGPQTLCWGLPVTACVPWVTCSLLPWAYHLQANDSPKFPECSACPGLVPATLCLHHSNGLARKSFRSNADRDKNVPMTYTARYRH